MWDAFTGCVIPPTDESEAWVILRRGPGVRAYHQPGMASPFFSLRVLGMQLSRQHLPGREDPVGQSRTQGHAACRLLSFVSYCGMGRHLDACRCLEGGTIGMA